MQMPGHPDRGMYPSSTLTSRKVSYAKSWSCSAQKFPCFFPKQRSRKLEKVTKSILLTHILCNHNQFDRLPM